MNMSRESESPVNRALLDIIKARSAKGASGPVDLDALMEAARGEAAARWRAAGVSGRAWETYREAEQAYWDSEDLRQLRLQTVATLRMAETVLLKTALTPEHRRHGWSDEMIKVLASMCADSLDQVEADTFANREAGYALGRTKMEAVSPKWPDLDELSVAIDLAGRMLDILSRRLTGDPDKASG
jgi:hypothetical protein